MKQVPILMYHWFRRAGEPSSSRSPQLEITPELFERQLAWLARAGFRGVTVEQALDPASARASNVAITFDDGTLDFWEHARPALARHGFRATLFVVTGHVGGTTRWERRLGEPERPLLDWDQLRELRREGFEIGSHTETHRPLPELDDDEARAELSGSRRALEEALGTPPRFLAYPRGAHLPRHRRFAREAGYAGACAVILGWRDLAPTDRFALRRMTIKGSESMLRFRLRLVLCRLVRLHRSGASV